MNRSTVYRRTAHHIQALSLFLDSGLETNGTRRAGAISLGSVPTAAYCTQRARCGVGNVGQIGKRRVRMTKYKKDYVTFDSGAACGRTQSGAFWLAIPNDTLSAASGTDSTATRVLICPYCKSANTRDAFRCSACRAPIEEGQ